MNEVIIRFLAGAALLLAHQPAALSIESARTGLIESMQTYGSVRASSPGIAWVKMAGSWPGVSCAADWVWFNVKDNPGFAATVLYARSTSTPVKVYIDDAVPKIGTFCAVTVIEL